MAYLTDKELLERYQFCLIQLEKRLAEGEDVKAIINRVPGMIILSKFQEIEIVYTNKKHEEFTGYSIDKIRKECSKYLDDIVHPISLENVRKFLPEFYATQNFHQTTAFVQYAQLADKTDYTPIVTFTKPPKGLNGLVLRLAFLSKELSVVFPKIKQVVEMDHFKLSHFKRFQKLTEREVEILKLLANGYNNPEIANRLFLSRSTIETHRKHLKKKLEIRSFKDLMKYAFAFDLVEI